MGFRVGAYAKIWKIAEDKGNYAIAQVSVSRKKEDKYVTEFQSNFVRLVGKAYEKGKDIQEVHGGTTIKISACDVTNRYVKEQQKEYVNFVIFDFDFPDNNGGNQRNASTAAPAPAQKQGDSGFMNIPDGIDEELPFN